MLIYSQQKKKKAFLIIVYLVAKKKRKKSFAPLRFYPHKAKMVMISRLVFALPRMYTEKKIESALLCVTALL